MDPNQSQGTSIEERLNAYHNPETPQPAAQVTQPEPTPSSEQPQPTENVSPPQPPADVEEKEALENSKNPERTRAYIEKLKTQLREKDSALSAAPQPVADYGTSVYDVFHPEQQVRQPEPIAPQMPQVNMNQLPGLNPMQVQNIQSQFVDQEGNVDIAGLNRALADANSRAMQAAEEARRTREQMARFEESQQVREAHSQYPELDPSNKEKFNPQFFEMVRDRLVRNMWEGKKNIPLVAVAKEIRQVFGQQPQVNTAQVATKAVEEYKQNQANRIQGPIEQGRGEGRSDTASYTELRRQTRTGGINSPALDKRLEDYFKSK